MFTKLITTAGFLIMITPAISQNKKDSLGLPGDNFDLYGAMELFKKSANPEAFEKSLNSKDNEINNLDLDADGKVDYIKVVDKTENNVHTIIMQVAVSKDELQDVAVIHLEKTGSDKAHIQIVGDEELYGKNYIIEPVDETKKNAKGERIASDSGTDDVYKGSNESDDSRYNTANDNNNNNNGGGNTTVINVWGWPSVQYMYAPSYVAWNSPWYWGYYPTYWDPWYPVYWRVYHRRMYHYHYPYYGRAYYYRSPAAHNYYYGRRSSANTVREHNRSGYYHQKQQSYRGNVEPGKRYNNRPASPRNNSSQGREQPRGNNSQPARQNRSGGSQQSPRSNQSQQAAPRQNNNRSSSQQRGSGQRQQANPQPRQQQVSPQQRGGGGGARSGGGSSSSPGRSGGGGGGSPRSGGR